MSSNPSDHLAQIRDEVHALTQSPEEMKHFRVMVKAFVGARWQGQGKAVWLEKREKHFAQVAKNPRLQDKNAGPPHKGWVYDSDLVQAQQPLAGWVSPKQSKRIGKNPKLLEKYLRMIQRSKRLTSYKRDQTKEKMLIPPGKGYELRSYLPSEVVEGWCPPNLSKAMAPPAPPNPFAFERRRVSIEEKYLVLAAAHDAPLADKNQHIDPWEYETKPDGVVEALRFAGEHEQYRLWVEASQRKLNGHSDDVRGYLENVRQNLEAQGLLAADKKKAGCSKGGRPRVNKKEEKKRMGLIRKWKRAKEGRTAQKDFCTDNHITLPYLQKIIDWNSQRERRRNANT